MDSGKLIAQGAGQRVAELEWDDAYDRAMQARDWMSCEQLLDEREQAEWWKERDRDDN